MFTAQVAIKTFEGREMKVRTVSTRMNKRANRYTQQRRVPPRLKRE